MLRFIEDQYIHNYKPTIGIDFKCKKIKIGEINIKLQVWDTAGQERFGTLTQAYFQKADGVILAYDCSNKKSYDNLETWLEQLQGKAKAGVQTIIVGTKCDLDLSKKVVTSEMAKKFASDKKLNHFETSAQLGTNID